MMYRSMKRSTYLPYRFKVMVSRAMHICATSLCEQLAGILWFAATLTMLPIIFLLII